MEQDRAGQPGQRAEGRAGHGHQRERRSYPPVLAVIAGQEVGRGGRQAAGEDDSEQPGQHADERILADHGGTAGPGHEQAGHRHRRQGTALRAQVREGLPGQQPRGVLTGGSGASRRNRRNRGTTQAQRYGAITAVRLARPRGRRPAEGGRAQPGKPAQPAGPTYPPRITAEHSDDAEEQPQRAEVQNLLVDGVDGQREQAGHDARRIGHGRGHRRRQRPPENR